jgi:hypothetical protein
MAHFAKLNSNNEVIDLAVVNNDVIMSNGVESEQAGIDFLASIFNYSNWKQTSYNANFRGKYASIGDVYDEDLDIFKSIDSV